MSGRRSLVLALGLALAMSALWLLVIPWDLSEIDSEGMIRSNGGDDIFGSWRALVLTTGWFVAAVGATAYGLSRRLALLAVVVVGSFWFMWRTGSARVSGANLFLVGWFVVFLPTTLIGGGLAVWLGGRLSRARLTDT